MLLTTEIEIKIEGGNINYYKSLGYNNIKVKDIIKIPIEQLPKTSHKKVLIKCDKCGDEKKSHYFAYNKYLENSKESEYLCYKCNDKNRKRTLLDKYGEDSLIKIKKFNDKRKNTIKKKFGFDHQCKSNEIKQKIIGTNVKKYGVKYPAQSTEIRNKINNTNLEKYGNISSLINDKTLEKTFNTMIGKYGVKYSTQSEEILDKIISNGLLTKINKIKRENNDILEIENGVYVAKCDQNKEHNYKIDSHSYYQRKMYKIPICTICNPIQHNISGNEVNILNFIKENYNNEIILNSRNIIPPLELDIYIPELKLAFEFNGLYWHSELYKEKNYHLNKTEECEKNNIQLIHIYEDDWLYKQDIVKSMILNKLGKIENKIYARKTEVTEVFDNKLVREFLEKNHIQGFVGSNIKLGLFYDDELVSLMTFGKRRVAMGKKSTNDGEYELLRFCNKLNTNVVGGASKLFKYFINNYKPKEITTYADRSFSQGNLYKQLGFEFTSKTEPNYYYIIDGIRHHRFNFRKDKLVKEGYDKNKTEHQIMIERKIYRIYDSGNLKFIYK